MLFMNPHFWHAAAYLLLTMLVIRIGYRVLITARFSGLPLGEASLQHAKARVMDLLSLDAVRVTPMEIAVMIIAHLMLFASAAVLIVKHGA